MVYRVTRYAADGHSGEPSGASCPYADGETVTVETSLASARRAVREALGVRTLSGLRWGGGEGSVEAYHEHRTRVGCGGYTIEDTTSPIWQREQRAHEARVDARAARGDHTRRW